MNVSFPLRDDFFRPMQCSHEDARRYKQLMRDLLAQSLEEERPYWASHYTFVDSKRWKPLKDKDRIRTYQARRSLLGGRGGSAQAVLGLGTIDGSLEDVISGMHHLTTRDMRATSAFLRDNSLDAAVLHVFENGTPHDPLRSLSVKWRVVETPGGSFVANRDGCVLEYMGIDVDASGHRYAFHISENLDHGVCPPFSTKCAVRAKAHARILFREISPGRVGMFFKGDFGLGGKLPGSLARRTAAEMALGISRSVACTEAKKLTALALTVSPIFHQQSSQFLPTLAALCSICSTRPGYLSTKSMSWCKVCGAPVCSKCKSRKLLLSDDKQIRISCCKQCLVAAKQFPLDPTRPLPLISYGQWLSLVAGYTKAYIGRSLDRSYVSSISDTRSNTEASIPLSTTTSAADLSIRSFDHLDNLLTPMSTADSAATTPTYDDHVALLECADMASVIEEDEDEVPTLGDEFRFNRKISIDDEMDFDLHQPKFARSAFTPSVAKSEEQAAIHREADRMSLFAQMRRLRDQAESAYSMTQANGWEIMGSKNSTSSFSSSMRSTAAMSTSSHGSTTYGHTSLG